MKKWHLNEAIVLQWPVQKCLVRLQTCEKAMGWCTAQYKMLPFCVKTIEKESRRRSMKKSKTFWPSGNFLVWYFSDVFSCYHVVHHQNTRRWTVWCYKSLAMYKLAVFEILRDFFVLSYIGCPHYPYIHIESTDSMIIIRYYNTGESCRCSWSLD